MTAAEAAADAAAAAKAEGDVVSSPLAGNIFKINVKPGQKVQQGDVVLIMEAMKMETKVRAPHGGRAPVRARTRAKTPG